MNFVFMPPTGEPQHIVGDALDALAAAGRFIELRGNDRAQFAEQLNSGQGVELSTARGPVYIEPVN